MQKDADTETERLLDVSAHISTLSHFPEKTKGNCDIWDRKSEDMVE